MPKVPSSAVGIDLGRYSLKSVVLQRRGGNRFVLSHFASRVIGDSLEDPARLASELKTLVKDMGGSAKACSLGVSSSDALLRIIDQPETPVHILRDALRLNGMTLLNQDCKEFVLDCDLIPSSEPNSESTAPAGAVPHHRYLVGGLRRTRIAQIDEAFAKNHSALNVIQLAPICVFNAFQFANESIFNNEAFLLVDMGHVSSSVTVGVKKELLLVRSIEYGGKALIEALMSHGNSRADVLRSLNDGDETTVENARLSLTTLTREISSSIGFFEGRREETISRIFVSGGPASSQSILKIMTQELKRPCEAWNPIGKCEVAVPPAKRSALAADAPSFAVACGAAAELLIGP